MVSIRLLFVVGLSFGATSVSAEDWPQWMGPRRDGTWNQEGVVDRIPESGLTVAWRVEVGSGYSGPAVVGDRVFLTDYITREGAVANDPGKRVELQGDERVLCFDRTTGKLLWKYTYNCPYKISYPSGPRTTPAIDDGHVYTLGAEGHLCCLDAETGEKLWSRELKQDYKVDSPQWGYSGHPLIDGDKLFIPVGGQGTGLVAFHKQTGQELWRALNTTAATYCPPSIIEHGGRRQLLLWDPERLNSLDPERGELLWSMPLKPSYEMSIMMPRLAGDSLFASGIGRVGVLYKLDPGKPAATVQWIGQVKSALYAANSTPLIDGPTIYGADCESGLLMAVKLENGERLWESAKPTTGTRRGSHGTAFLVKNGSRYFIFSETGDLILAELTPQAYTELGRFHVVDPTGECFGREVVWSHPAFAHRACFARNDKELVSVSLAK